MDLHQLRCFVVLAEELHFGRAARRLNMTQPPFSRQIQLLEKSLGGALFERDNRHVRLTFLGEQLLGRANQLLQQAEQFTFTAQSCLNGESGTLSIGFTAVFSWAFIPALLKNLHAALPGLNIHLHENVSNKQIIAIENESIDVGFVRKVPLNPSLDYLPLKSEALVGAFHVKFSSALLPDSPSFCTARMRRVIFLTASPIFSRSITSCQIININWRRLTPYSDW